MRDFFKKMETYIYIYRERERERERFKKVVVNYGFRKFLIFFF